MRSLPSLQYIHDNLDFDIGNKNQTGVIYGSGNNSPWKGEKFSASYDHVTVSPATCWYGRNIER